jgi:DNA-binding response OmpR family regulator
MKADPSVARLRFDRFELDEAEARLTCDGEPIALAPKPFAVLCAPARTPKTFGHCRRDRRTNGAMHRHVGRHALRVLPNR